MKYFASTGSQRVQVSRLETRMQRGARRNFALDRSDEFCFFGDIKQLENTFENYNLLIK